MPNKNIKLLAGQSLIERSIKAATLATSLNEVAFSSDSDEYIEIARSLGLSVKYKRPEKLAKSDTPTISCVIDYLNWLDARNEQNFSHIVLPGVGSFDKGIENLKNAGFIEEIYKLAEKGNFILGICLGFQLMCKSSEEFGFFNGLGWLNLEVKKINSSDLRLPHVGWNKIKINQSKTSFFSNIKEDQMLYFNHTYAVKNSNNNFSDLMTCHYGENFIAAIKHNNIFGIQPHPEKSQKTGLQIIKNLVYMIIEAIKICKSSGSSARWMS